MRSFRGVMVETQPNLSMEDEAPRRPLRPPRYLAELVVTAPAVFFGMTYGRGRLCTTCNG
jgi:hypothetical protein